MAASLSDLFTYVAYGTLTNLAAPGYTVGNSSLNGEDLSVWPTPTAVYFGIDMIDASGARIDGSYSAWKAIVSSNTLGSLTFLYGDDQDYPAGSSTRLFILDTSALWNALIDGLSLEHNKNGTHDATKVAMLAGTQTFTGDKTFSGALTASGSISGITPAKFQNPYKFSVYRSAAWTSSNGTPSKVQYDTKLFDTSTNYDNSTNYRFTAPIAGFYQFNAAAMAAMTSGSIYFTSIYKNGSEFHRGNQTTTASAQNALSTVNALMQLSANDYIEIFFQGVGGGGLTGTAATYFQGALKSAT